MRVVVLGAGAVGGHLAARLAAHGSAAGIEVAAVARGAQLEAMNQRGITLWIGQERTSAPIHATDRPETLGRQDVILVTLKSSVLPAAASQLQPLIGPETTVVFAMNGIPWWYLYRLDDGGVPRPDLSQAFARAARIATPQLDAITALIIEKARRMGLYPLTP
jgi:2-dehydropantoate 2-reductase